MGTKHFRDSVIQKEELLKENYRKKAKSFLTNNIYSFPGTNNWEITIKRFCYGIRYIKKQVE